MKAKSRETKISQIFIADQCFWTDGVDHFRELNCGLRIFLSIFINLSLFRTRKLLAIYFISEDDNCCQYVLKATWKVEWLLSMSRKVDNNTWANWPLGQRWLNAYTTYSRFSFRGWIRWHCQYEITFEKAKLEPSKDSLVDPHVFGTTPVHDKISAFVKKPWKIYRVISIVIAD